MQSTWRAILAFRHWHLCCTIWNRRNFDLWSWRVRSSVWGDGWADLPISTIWRDCTWDEVSEDELVIFLPALALWAKPHEPASILTLQSYLKAALSGWIAQFPASASW